MVSNAYQGFCPFRRHHRIVHWLGYLSGFGIWILCYLVVGYAFPSFGLVSVAIAATVASVLTGIHMGLLYSRAIGSPWGNMLLPMGIPLLIPELLIGRPFPGTALPEGWFGTLAVGIGGMIGGTVVVFKTIQNQYAKMDDISTWERTVMPHSVRVVGEEWLAEQPAYDREYKTLRPPLNPRVTEWLDVRFDLKQSLLGMIVAAPAIAAGAFGSVTYDDFAFDVLMAVAIVYLLHSALRIERRDSER